MKSNLKSFENYGFVKFDNLIDKDKCKALYNDLRNCRNWGPSLFLSEKEFKNNPQIKKTNPGKNIHNLIDKYNLDFIEKNSGINKILNKLLGKNFEIMLSKFVVAVPESWMPKYVKNIHKKSLISNFNPYIKKEYRDVTHFRGIDYHMDSIDWENQNNKFITMYIYLNKVEKYMSPLNVIKKSHKLGHTSFPHYIRDFKNKDYLLYSSDNKKFSKYKKETLVGNTGAVYFWTSNTLHGTSPSKSKRDDFRISLRYLIKKKSKNKSLIDKIINQDIIQGVRSKKKNYKRVLV